jgi:hypothetical protein
MNQQSEWMTFFHLIVCRINQENESGSVFRQSVDHLLETDKQPLGCTFKEGEFLRKR